MSISITLGWWLLPLAVTVAVWGWALRPRGYTGTYDFGGLFDAFVAIGATLAAWMIYFASVAFVLWKQA